MRSTAVVTAAATYRALTTLDRVKSELGISGSANDTLLTAKIKEASSDIEARCRTFCRETIAVTFWPAAGATISVGALVLPRYPIVSVSSVLEDGVAVDSAERRADPDSGMLYRLDADGYPALWSAAKSIVVTYVGGYTMPGEADYTLPPSLESACVDLVSSYWASRGRDPTVRAESVPGVLDTTYWVGAVGEKGDLPPAVEAKIAPFRRLVL